MGFIVLYWGDYFAYSENNWMKLEKEYWDGREETYSIDLHVNYVIAWLGSHIHELANESDLAKLARTAKNLQIINGNGTS